MTPQLQLNWILLDFGRRSSSVERRSQELFQANFAFNRKLQEVAFAVSRNYFSLDSSRAPLTAARATLESAVAVEEAVGARVEQGLAMRPDFLLARQERARAAFEVEDARGAVDDAQAALADSLGIPPTALMRVADLSAGAAVEQGVAARRGAARAVEQSRHDVSRAQDQLAQFGDLNARIQAAEASVRAAELDVGYCRVSAPFDAYVTNLNIAVGEYARQGQQIFALVDNRAWYVLANFRETYMPSIKPGMEADVYLLTYPGRRFRGIVQGIGWANHPDDGATIGVLPDVQRTMNWVRLANRFQVRIRLDERDAERPFRMGTTAVVTMRGFPRGTSSALPTR